MKIVQLTPGTGHFYCGSCLRDDALGRALSRAGHEVDVVPLYLPHHLEEGGPTRAEPQVHMGGINMYLQQKSRLAGLLPLWLTRTLDRPGLLRWASRRGSMTASEALGAMTVSMLRGEEGQQVRELDKLLEWLSEQDKPDVVVLSNVMLVGIVRRLRERLGVPVLCTLQGEMPFLDTLPEPYRSQAWETLRERVADVAAFIPVSRDYGERMGVRLGVGAHRLHVVHNGIDPKDFLALDRPERPRRTIGYIARMCADKGLHTLVDAFIDLARRGTLDGLRLRVAGVMLQEDREFVAEQERKLAAGGLASLVEFLPNISRSEKLRFFESLDLMSVPATYGESFGLYLVEAMAAGVPVVQPDHGSFPEILEASSAGRICAPDDSASLADGMEQLLSDPDSYAAASRAGRAAAQERFHVDRMANDFLAVASGVVQKSGA